MRRVKREGPSFLTWLMGRFSYPPPAGHCAVCGASGADSQVVRELRAAGLGRLAHFAALCDRCRMARRDDLLRGGA